MAITDSFRKAVTGGDVKDIRIMMKDSLLIDPSFIEFQEMSHLAQNVVGLYDKHDGRQLSNDRTDWNDDYMALLSVQLVDNFSRERIEHLKKVIQYLHPSHECSHATNIPHTTMTSTSTRDRSVKQYHSSYQKRKYQDTRNNRISSSNNQMEISAVAGGVIGSICAGAMGSSILVGAMVGACTVIVAVFVVTKGGK